MESRGEVPENFGEDEKAGQEPLILLPALRAYQKRESLDDNDLAAFLGCQRKNLSRLALRRVPETVQMLKETARATGVDARRLVQILKAVAEG